MTAMLAYMLISLVGVIGLLVLLAYLEDAEAEQDESCVCGGVGYINRGWPPIPADCPSCAAATQEERT